MRTAETLSTSRTIAAPATLTTLLHELIDYAGLFPPAALSMDQAVRKYAEYRVSPEAWALGRFVTSVARLPEFEAAFASLPGQNGIWRIAALLGEDTAADLSRADAFNHARQGHAVTDVVEARTPTAEEISRVAKFLPNGVTAYCEISPLSPARLLSAIHETGMRAKIRTGGLTEDAFPSAEDIAEFLCACAAANVAFKATAGLHHPLRCRRPLTYEPNADSGTMHGFLNLFLAAALAYRGERPRLVSQLLLASEESEFKFGVADVTWRDLSISLDEISRARTEFAISFGSCSFEEPISDLEELRLL